MQKAETSPHTLTPHHHHRQRPYPTTSIPPNPHPGGGVKQGVRLLHVQHIPDPTPALTLHPHPTPSPYAPLDPAALSHNCLIPTPSPWWWRETGHAPPPRPARRKTWCFGRTEACPHWEGGREAGATQEVATAGGGNGQGIRSKGGQQLGGRSKGTVQVVSSRKGLQQNVYGALYEDPACAPRANSCCCFKK